MPCRLRRPRRYTSPQSVLSQFSATTSPRVKVAYDEQPLPSSQASYSTHMKNAVCDQARGRLGNIIAEEKDGETNAHLLRLVPRCDGVQGRRNETSLHQAASSQQGTCMSGPNLPTQAEA